MKRERTKRASTAAAAAREYGLENGLETMVKETGASRETLRNWYYCKPKLFNTLLVGCLTLQKINYK